jgi:hypothetical protein
LATILDLEVINGVDQGKRVRLNATESLILGRSTKGFHVQDQLVNVRHAEIAWVTDRYWVTDLGSVTGTWVNDERLGPNQPRVIAVSDRIRVGETDFVVRERITFSIEALVRGVLGVAIAFAVGALVYKIASTPVVYEPKVGWPVPIQHQTGESQILEVPLDFLRKRAYDYHQMRIRRVSDFDKNGVDEMWITHGDEEEVVTFGPSGEWVGIGILPAGCRDMTTSTFPELRCGPDTFRFDGLTYVPASQEGIIAWLPPVSQAESDGEVGQVVHRPDTWSAPTPFRLSIRNPESLAGFLGERGITEPIHYLICEEAIPGLAAQVLLQSGEIRKLGFGCIRAMHLTGPERTKRFGAHVPSLIAFTGFGRQALLQDLNFLLSGSDEGLFLDYRERQMIDTLSQHPENLLTSHRVSFQASPRHFTPVASGTPSNLQRVLERSDLGRAPKASVHMATLLTEGVARLQPDGCTDLVVTTGQWQCAMTRACMPARRFLTVTDVGCGPERVILSLPYSGGVATGFTPDVEIRAQVETRARGLQTDVLRSRIGFRYLKDQ